MANPSRTNRPENAQCPFQILNIENINEPARINIYDVIGETWWDEGITGKAFAADVAALGSKRELEVYINSGGGDIMDGTLMYSTLLNHQGKITFIIDGWAISMASVVPMVPNCTVKMSKLGMMMIHKPLNGCQGNANDMRKNAETLDKVESALSHAYTNKTGLSSEDIASMLDAETWMTADEAKDKGFIDEIIEEPGTAITNSFNADNLSAYRNVPQNILMTLDSDDSQEDSSEDDEGTDDIFDKQTDEPNESEVNGDTDDSTETNDDVPPVEEEESPVDLVAAERARNKSIMVACRTAGMSHLAENYVDKSYSLEMVQDLLSEIKAGKEETPPIQHSSQTPPSNVASSWDDAYEKAGIKTN